MAAVLEACLDGQKNLVTLDPVKLTRMAAVMKPYLDSQDREVQALYSLQALVHRLEHPNKLLHSIFDVLYEVELISEVHLLYFHKNLPQGSLKVVISVYPYLQNTPNFSRCYKKLGPFYKKLKCDKFGN